MYLTVRFMLKKLQEMKKQHGWNFKPARMTTIALQRHSSKNSSTTGKSKVLRSSTSRIGKSR